MGSYVIMGYQFGYGLNWSDLHHNLEKVDHAFVDFLRKSDAHLCDALLQARQTPPQERAPEDALLIALAPYLEDFVSRLFGITSEALELSTRHHNLAPLFHLKRTFIQRKAARAPISTDPDADHAQLESWIGSADEIAWAQSILQWEEQQTTQKLECALRYSAWAVQTPAGRQRHRNGFFFRLPQPVDPLHRFPTDITVAGHGATADALQPRAAFVAPDPGLTFAQAAGEAHYCIYCHKQDRDSCAHGLRDRHTGAVVIDAVGIVLKGCPLDQKISQSHELLAQGLCIGALAMIVVDNPMVAATGRRICNNCMQACIYQKQDSVDIPATETALLDSVLELPFGFEIYSLLTRWNPLNLEAPLPKPATGFHVLVVGMGPAGFTLAHHLLNAGHNVMGIDGLKIEPLSPALRDAPLKDIQTLYGALKDQPIDGFGGVCAYGITTRWDKKYLTLIRLLLERRAHFYLQDGIRFGGTLTPEQAFTAGFDHIALCAGAGKPRILKLPNALAQGVRQASDFLMSLQLTGAAYPASLANLQIQLPVLVIGGGLTAVDTATEALAYYPVQVQKFAQRYAALVEAYGQEAVEASWSPQDHEIAQIFLSHAQQLEGCDAAQRLNLLQSWGGASIVYRKRLQEAPAYRQHATEVHHALRQGVWFYEQADPQGILVDDQCHVRAVHLQTPEGMREKPARCVLVAAGTQPNVTLAREFPDAIPLDGDHFQSTDAGDPLLMRQEFAPEGMSFFGDLNPAFSGNVVQAMASAKKGAPLISQVLARTGKPRGLNLAALQHDLHAHIHAVYTLAPRIIALVVHAPLAARNFQPGQFYRLQNYRAFAPRASDRPLEMEGIALTGAAVDRESGLITLIVLENGGSTALCRHLKPGERVVLMGPSGTPTEISKNKKVLLIGGGLGNAVLFSIGQALRASGCTVIYIAGYTSANQRFWDDQVEAAADQVIWCVESDTITPARPTDRFFPGNVVQALENWSTLSPLFELNHLERVLTIGSDRMMAAVQKTLRHIPFPDTACLQASINAPMQCMMKEICAQCLQTHTDPITGETHVVYACAQQDQNLRTVDFASLHQRLTQNSLTEKLTHLWIEHAIRQMQATNSPEREEQED